MEHSIDLFLYNLEKSLNNYENNNTEKEVKYTEYEVYLNIQNLFYDIFTDLIHKDSELEELVINLIEQYYNIKRVDLENQSNVSLDYLNDSYNELDKYYLDNIYNPSNYEEWLHLFNEVFSYDNLD